MTEYLLNLNSGNAGAAAWSTYSEAAIWNESLKMLGTVHDAMSNNWNAYIWWYLQRFYSFIGDGEQTQRDVFFVLFAERFEFYQVDIALERMIEIRNAAFWDHKINCFSSLRFNICASGIEVIIGRNFVSGFHQNAK